MWRKRSNKYGLKRKSGLVIGVSWVLSGVSVRILELVDKLLGVRLTGMQGKEESKGGESASLLSPSSWISGMRFILRGVEL